MDIGDMNFPHGLARDLYEAAKAFVAGETDDTEAFDKIKAAVDALDKSNDERDCEREAKVIDCLPDRFRCSDDIDIDDSPIISEGDDNGAYVQAWIWAPFAGTELDKEEM